MIDMRTRILIAALLCLAACEEAVDPPTESEEIANAVGDVLASFDETSEAAALALRPPARVRPPWPQRLSQWLLPVAHAHGGRCSEEEFTRCRTGKRHRYLFACNIGAARLDGVVTIAYADEGCSLDDVGETATRTAEITLYGQKGKIELSAPDGGQRVTRTERGFSYEVLGLRRLGTSGEQTLFDVNVKSLSPHEVTGASRADRVLSEGKLEISHALTGAAVTLEPRALQWDASCTCPVRGTLEGTNGQGEKVTVELTGCAQATITTEGSAEHVTLDRCAEI